MEEDIADLLQVPLFGAYRGLTEINPVATALEHRGSILQRLLRRGAAILQFQGAIFGQPLQPPGSARGRRGHLLPVLPRSRDDAADQ